MFHKNLLYADGGFVISPMGWSLVIAGW